MREVIRQIKKGNLKYFISLVDKYSSSVYSEALKKYEKDKAINVTYRIFLKLYKDIDKSFGFRNGERIIINSLKKSCKQYKIAFSTSNSTTDVPPQIMRTLFVELSKCSKKAKIKRIFTYGTICAVVLIIAILFDNSQFLINTNKTIYNVSPSTKLVYEIPYDFEEPTSVSTIKNLQDKGVLVDMFIGDKHSCEIWQSGKKISSFELPKLATFESGYFELDRYIFSGSNQLYCFNRQGTLIDTIVIDGNTAVESENNRFLAIEQDKSTFKIFDTKEFKYTQEVQGKILTISNNGYVITANNNPTKDSVKQVVCLKAFSYDKAVVVYNNGEVALFDNDTLLWSKTITISKKLRKKVGSEIKKAYAFPNNNMINVVVEFEDRFILQSFNTLDGTEKVNTIESLQIGTLIKSPSISIDQKMIYLESQEFHGYYPVRNISLVDVSSYPLKKIPVNTNNMICWAYENTDDESYMYVYDIGSLRVVKMDFN